MANFKKVYFAKGTQVDNFDIVKISLPVESIKGHTYFYEGIEYFSFEVAKLKEPTKYGKTHTCYFSQKENPNGEEQRKHTPESVLDACLKVGRIVASGSWYKHLGKNIAHGRTAMLEKIKTDSELYSTLILPV